MSDMSTTNEIQVGTPSPVQVLRAFMTAMNEWERNSYQEFEKVRNGDGDWISERQHRLQGINEIFAQYCTPKDRPLGRQGSFGHPPEYDPETEQVLEIVEESKRRVVIYTQEGTRFRNKCRYVLLCKGDKWLLDSKQWQDVEGKWQRGAL